MAVDGAQRVEIDLVQRVGHRGRAFRTDAAHVHHGGPVLGDDRHEAGRRGPRLGHPVVGAGEEAPTPSGTTWRRPRTGRSRASRRPARRRSLPLRDRRRDCAAAAPKPSDATPPATTSTPAPISTARRTSDVLRTNPARSSRATAARLMNADVPNPASSSARAKTLSVSPTATASTSGRSRRVAPTHSAAARASAAGTINTGSAAMAREVPAATATTHHGAIAPTITTTAVPTARKRASTTGEPVGCGGRERSSDRGRSGNERGAHADAGSDHAAVHVIRQRSSAAATAR